MNPFDRHSIVPNNALERKTEKAQTWIKGHLILSILLLVLGVVILKGVVDAIRTGNPLQIVMSTVGKDLKTDAQGHTNILLLGIGGKGHDGANLTDTMMVASIDTKGNTLSMLSVPRDLYIKDNAAVGWDTRLNSIYQFALDNTQDPVAAEAAIEEQIEEIMGVDIQYYAKIDFKGFQEVIDAIGGVTVNVETPIADTSYPAPDGSGRTYDPFYLSIGVQTLDGETALKYVRSRHNSSDFDRAQRQQQVLAALKEKATSLGFLSSPGKIKDVYTAISKNFESNLTVSEMISLADEAQNFDSDSIQSAVVNDAPNTTGGFVYAPPREEGEAFYLVPYTGDFSEIQAFAQLFFYHPEVYKDPVPIQILNGTPVNGLGGLTKMALVRYGFNVYDYGNAESKTVQNTSIYKQNPDTTDPNALPLPENTDATLELLKTFLIGSISEDVPLSYKDSYTSPVLLELGQDFAEFYAENEKIFYLGYY